MSTITNISQKLSKLKRNYTQMKALYLPKFDTFIDKYKIIKVGCIVGTCNSDLKK